MTRRFALAGAAAFVLAHVDGGRLQAVVDGQPLSLGKVLSIDVDCGLLVPAVCAAAVPFTGGTAREKLPPAGAPLAVDAASEGSTASIFKGEIISVEPVFEEGGETKVVLRALNRLHRLTRGKKTRTFESKSDAEIAAQIASEAGLAFGPTGAEVLIKHDHVFQHNQTDLEFLRVRAARIGYEVLVDDWALRFQRHADPPPTLLGCAPTRALSSAQLKVFHPRLASANSVSKV